MVKLNIVATILVGLCQLNLAQKKVAVGPRGDGLAFKKCGGGFLSSGKDICYDVKVSKLKVQMGDDGTKDDVKVKICSDVNPKKPVCCLTSPLKVASGQDWKRNNLETWSGNSLGDCKGKSMTVNKGLSVSLQKAGKDSVKVTSILLYTEGVTSSKKTTLEQFKCGSTYIAQGIATGNGTKPVSCSPFPYALERVKLINVTMGNQGTNDDVLVDICSDVNDVCCRTKLSSTFSDDWSKNDNEVWEEKHLDKCKTMVYKVRDGLKFGLATKKNDKKALVVNKILVSTENTLGKATTYDCKGFTMTGKDFLQNKCTKSGSLNKTSTRRSKTTTKKPTAKTVATTKKKGLIGQGLDLIKGKSGTKTSTTVRPLTTKTTTTRRPFRSGSGK